MEKNKEGIGSSELIRKIAQEAQVFFADSRGSHDWEHTLRVYNLCLHLGKKEKADMEILEIAAILHDIGREEQDKNNGEICHAEKGAELAEKFLEEIKFKKNKIQEIIHCIRTHRFRGKNIPESKEARVLFDADKLDSIGAVGIGRAFLFAGEIGSKLHNKDIDLKSVKAYTKEDTAYREYLVKLKKIKQKILTKEGKRIAKKRHSFMVKFFDRLNKEVSGDL